MARIADTYLSTSYVVGTTNLVAQVAVHRETLK